MEKGGNQLNKITILVDNELLGYLDYIINPSGETIASYFSHPQRLDGLIEVF